MCYKDTLNKLQVGYLPRQMQDIPEEGNFNFTYDIDGIRMMQGVVEYALEVWPGAPKRPHMEQEFLWHMRDQLRRCVLEHTLNNGTV